MRCVTGLKPGLPAEPGGRRELHVIMTTCLSIKWRRGLLALSLAMTVGAIAAEGELPRIKVDAAKAGASVNPMMWGLFFEDINFGADGGLHAQMIKNGAFEFANPAMGWRSMDASGQAPVIHSNTPIYSVSPRYLVLRKAGAVVNEGFRGMGVRAGESYQFSLYGRTVESGASSALRVELVGDNGAVLATARLANFSSQWTKHSAVLKSTGTDTKARLRLALEEEREVHLDHISLIPQRTWTGQANMLRADLVQLLADMKPGFLRFPGGCIVEGRTLPLRYQWKNTIGPVDQRPLLINRWNDEFKHRPAPDYFQTFSLGFFEYFLLCEDIGAEPLPILNCGMACQFNSGELAPLDQLDPYIQDALDLIEFANGDASTAWGSKRAAMGHAKPFGLEVLGIGNEQWGPRYIERYAAFARVLKARHPGIKLISSAGPAPADDKFRFLWPKLRDLKADIVDEHCYANPGWFFDNASRYDSYDRNGPKVFMGEYAAQSVKVVSPENRNTLECALAEAAYMTGLERNADVVVMSAYAPLLAHVDAWQWTPNLIWFDNLRSVATANYYVQQLFSRNRGDTVLPLVLEGLNSGANGARPLLYASSVREAKTGEVIIKVVNPGAEAITARVEIAGQAATETTTRAGEITVLTGQDLQAENTLDNPRAVFPARQRLEMRGDSFTFSFAPRSLSVLRAPMGR